MPERFILPTLRTTKRRGIALILVIIVITLLTTAALSFALLMQQNHQSSRDASYQYQTDLATESGMVIAKAYVEMPADRRQRLGGIQDRPGFFTAALTIEEFSTTDSLDTLDNTTSESWMDEADGAEETATFEMDSLESAEPLDLTSPATMVFEYFPPVGELESVDWTTQASTESGIRFGMTDECTKLNLRRLLYWEQLGWPVSEMLQQHCGLTIAQADHLLDWIDADSTPREFGGEREEYASQGLSYGPANQIPDSYQQLLLIPGFDAPKIYGSTWLLPQPPRESEWGDDFGLENLSTQSWVDQAESTSLAFSDEEVSNRPLIETLALHDGQELVDGQGKPLIWLNEPNLPNLQQLLTEEFSDELASYLCLGRLYGFQDGYVEQPGENVTIVAASSVPIENAPPQVRINSAFQLLETHVLIPGSESSQLVNSPLRRLPNDPNLLETLARLLQRTYSQEPGLAAMGRVHFQHPVVVQLPGLSQTTREWLTKRTQEEDLLQSDSLDALGSSATSTGPTSVWYNNLAQAFIGGEIPLSDAQLLGENACPYSDVYSAWIASHSGYFQHFNLHRIVVQGSESGARQLYCQRFYLPAEVRRLLAARLSDGSTTPTSSGSSSPTFDPSNTFSAPAF